MKKLNTNEYIAVVVGLVVVIGVFIFGFGLSGLLGSFTNSLSASPSSMTDGQQLVVQDLVVGTGAEASTGDLLTVDYVGALQTGTVFDSSIERGTPFQFVLGAGQVIKGWDEGLAGMKVGGKRMLIISPELGYGAEQYGPIPGNSTLVFTVDLRGVEDR